MSRWVIPALCLTVAATASASAPVVIQLGSSNDRLTTPEYYRFRDLHYGRRSVQDASDEETRQNREVLRKAARWYAYRLTWPEYQDRRGEIGMSDLVQETCRQVPLATARKPLADEQLEFRRQFGRELCACLKAVLQDERPIVRVNAARILAHMAAAGQDDAADLLRTLIRTPDESDAVRLFAYRGLRDLFAINAADPRAATWRQRYLPVLLESVVRPSRLPADAAAAEIDAFRYVRREAVRAVVAARPLPTGDKTDQAVTVALLRVVQADGLRPGASLAERVEAAVGLLQPPAGKPAPVGVEVALHHVGTLVVDLARHAQRAAEGHGPEQLPWKLTAVRLGLALDACQDQLGESRPGVWAAPMVADALRVLGQIEKSETAYPAELQRWLAQNPPPPANASASAAAAGTHP